MDIQGTGCVGGNIGGGVTLLGSHYKRVVHHHLFQVKIIQRTTPRRSRLQAPDCRPDKSRIHTTLVRIPIEKLVDVGLVKDTLGQKLCRRL